MKRNFLSLATNAAFVASLLCGVAGSSGLCLAQTALYRLNADSTFQQGCFAPCLCPVMIGAPVNGVFLLTPTGDDGLFRTYAVTDVNWTFWLNGAAKAVTGSGTYRVGGEVALQQQLSLQLRIAGGNVEHFDSGLVGDTAPFPEISVAISTNGQYCFDTVFNLRASPLPVPRLQVGLAGPGAVVVSWAVSPTPFVLQESSDPTATTWAAVTNAPAVIGQQNQVVLARSSGVKFYRLRPGGN